MSQNALESIVEHLKTQKFPGGMSPDPLAAAHCTRIAPSISYRLVPLPPFHTPGSAPGMVPTTMHNPLTQRDVSTK